MLRVIASERIEPLVAHLANELMNDPADPMTPEWIAVGSDGLARWIQLELARHLGASPGRSDGVSANIIYARPGTLRTAVVLAGTDHPEFDPWQANQLTWAVLETLHRYGPDDEILEPFVDSTTRSVYHRASQIADRFSSYQLHRPEMIRAWRSGHDTDASGSPLPPHQAWQPHLWRLVREHVGVASHAERLTGGLEAIRDNSVPLVLNERILPSRLVFFGPSLLPTGAGFLEVAEAVAHHRDVLVYVIEPSSVLSGALRSDSSTLRAKYDRAHDATAALTDHPLLRSWGRLQRETALLLADLPLEPTPDTQRSDDTLLHALQSQIHGNDAPAGAFIHSVDDRSVALHRCYGPTRQVEVLKDTILSLLDDPDSDLTEDDIIVACPSLETFAPLIKAHFGPSATSRTSLTSDGSPLLRYQITGLSTGLDNPVTEGLIAAMELATSRFDVDQVVDFLALPAVRNRFGWGDGELELMGGWLDDTNVRWGIDSSHRTTYGIPNKIVSYTWRTALDQLILGTATTSETSTTIGGTIPVGFAAGEPELVGHLSGLIAKLEELAILSESPRSIDEWYRILDDLISTLLSADSDAEWQVDSTRRQLGRLVETSTLGTTPEPTPSSVPLTFRELREMISDVISEQRGRSDFFRGGVTITTFNALRNVPARVICILGADQGAFASGGIDSDDLIGTSPRLGDRDRRAEVRQTLLDAVMAARDRFIVLSDGVDVRTNTEIPPAVVVSELCDAIDAMCEPIIRSDDGSGPSGDAPGSVSERITTSHPRQPFAESYFDEEASSGRSFSLSSLQAARARRERDRSTGEIDWTKVRLVEPVADPDDMVTVGALKRLIKDPTLIFLQDGLGIRLPDEVDIRSPELPLEGDALDNWKLGTELMVSLSNGGDPALWIQRNIDLGNVPPAGLATARLSSIAHRATTTINAARAEGLDVSARRAVPVEVNLDDGRRLTGRVMTDPSDHRRTVPSIVFSNAKNEQLLLAWIDLLALTAMDDSRPWNAVVINPGKVDKKNTAPEPIIRHLRVEDTDSSRARTVLTMLASVHDTAVRQPVPFFPEVFGPDPDEDPSPGSWKHNNRSLSSEILFVYGDISLWDLRNLSADGHPLVPPGAPLAESYAALIWDAFRDTVALGIPGDDGMEVAQ